MKSSLGELHSLRLDIHSDVIRLRNAIDHLLVDVGRVDHQAELRTGQVTHFAALHLVPHLQVPCSLGADLPVPQHAQLVPQLTLLATTRGTLLAQPGIAQWRPASLHQEFSRIILLRQYHRRCSHEGKTGEVEAALRERLAGELAEAEGDHFVFAVVFEGRGFGFGGVVVSLAVEANIEGVCLAAGVFLAVHPFFDLAKARDSQGCVFQLYFGLVVFLPHSEVELIAELLLLRRSLRDDVAIDVVVAHCALIGEHHAGLSLLALTPGLP